MSDTGPIAKNRDTRVLKELHQLYLKKEEFLQLISKETSRLEHLNNQIKLKEELLSESEEKKQSLQKRLNELEKELSKEERELEQANSHLLDVTNEKQQKALEQEIANLSPIVDRLQEEILEVMEAFDLCGDKVKESEEFLKNVQVTLKEISDEVESENSQHNEQIEGLKKESQDLLNLLSSASKELYLLTEKKFSAGVNEKARNFFCELGGLNCTRCGALVDSEHRTLIEKQELLVACPGCRRIFLI